MIQTYRHFKKDEELFLGLSLWTIVKIALISLMTIFIIFKLGLSPNSPLAIFISIIWMIFTAIIIKSSLDYEVNGFYSSLLTHPFQNHIFPRHDTKESYQSIESLHNIKEVKSNHILSKEDDLIAVIKLRNGIAWNKSNLSQRELIIERWNSLLSQIQSVSSLDNYFLAGTNTGDTVQAFIELEPYQSPANDLNYDSSKANIEFSQKTFKQWYQKNFSEDKFIPEMEFYIVLSHQNTNNKKNIILKLLKKYLPEHFDDSPEIKAEQLIEQEKLLIQKLQSIDNALLQIGINSELLKDGELKNFTNKWIDINKEDSRYMVIDKSKYLRHRSHPSKFKYSKTYRISLAPSSGSLNYWLLEYFQILNTNSIISVQWISRDGNSDRRKAERKAEVMKQFSKSTKASTLSVIKENKQIAEELINESQSFDLCIFITIFSNKLEKIQKLDNQIKRPVRNSRLASLDRQQVENYFYSLPFCFNKLSDKDKLFANAKFAASCFPFVKSDLGSPEGPLVGSSCSDSRPIFLDEYNRDVCHNRGINFVGDSGSGKTVAAKLAVKRRLEDEQNSFYIVDNTEDGWKFFIDYFDGDIINIDSSLKLERNLSLFTPFDISAIKDDQGLVNAHIENISKLLTIVKDDRSTINTNEKAFILTSLRDIYQKQSQPCLSDLYQVWQSSENEYAKKWANIIAPYCNCTEGIYSSLMDGKKALLNPESRLTLFTFSKVDRDSSYLPVSLYLISNLISQKVLFEKQSKTTFIIDEAWKIFTGEANQKGKELLTHFARAGRGLDLGLWTISQKPSDLPREVHSSASATFCFQLKDQLDRNEMASYSNLTENETALINSPKIYEPGTALLKTTRASGLIKIDLDPIEEVLCNSTRDFVNKRDQIYKNYSKENSSDKASLFTVKEMINV